MHVEIWSSLGSLAHARSGDKGNHANIAVIAYTPSGYAWLRKRLTAERVTEFFRPLGPSRVERFEAPNVLGLNFVLHDVLAGGASRSLRIDSQGKALGLAILRMKFKMQGAEAQEFIRLEPRSKPAEDYPDQHRRPGQFAAKNVDTEEKRSWLWRWFSTK